MKPCFCGKSDKAIQICKGDSKRWLLDKGIEPASNAKRRREQIVEVLKNEI